MGPLPSSSFSELSQYLLLGTLLRILLKSIVKHLLMLRMVCIVVTIHKSKQTNFFETNSPFIFWNNKKDFFLKCLRYYCMKVLPTSSPLVLGFVVLKQQCFTHRGFSETKGLILNNFHVLKKTNFILIVRFKEFINLSKKSQISNL